MGSSLSLAGDEHAFYCPFCHHHKQKLQINLKTQKWHCWVCNNGGKKLTSLLKKLDVDRKTISVVRNYYGDTPMSSKVEEEAIVIHLPKEYISLLDTPSGFNPEYNQAIAYLERRGIDRKLIAKYNIGYCKDGVYARRIVIPSYDSNGNVNYFISRSYYENEKMKYKNPPVSKNIICLESHINWKEPIIFCEGIFDAISIKRNAVPLLGKFPSKKLVEKILTSKPKELTIALDNDAKAEAVKVSEYFRKQGINVKILYLKEKDPSELGYNKFCEKLKEAKEFSSEELLLNKILSL